MSRPHENLDMPELSGPACDRASAALEHRNLPLLAHKTKRRSVQGKGVAFGRRQRLVPHSHTCPRRHRGTGYPCMSFSPKWSYKQEAELIRRWPDDSLNGSPDIIAHDLGRSEGAIHRKAHKLGLPWKTRVTPRPDKGRSPRFDPTPWPDDMRFEDNPRAAAMPFNTTLAYQTGLAGYQATAMPTQTAMAEIVQPAGNVRKSRGAQ